MGPHNDRPSASKSALYLRLRPFNDAIPPGKRAVCISRTPMASQDPRLAELGWKPFFSMQISSEEDTQCQPVRVMAVHRGKIAVAGAGTEEGSVKPMWQGE